MRIVVRLFAAVREQAGRSTVSLELPEGACVADVWPALGLGQQPAGLAFAVDRSYADASTPLRDGAEVAVIPPVSGGGGRVWLQAAPLELSAVVERVIDDRAGAIATFTGSVRASTAGRAVEWLEYEAYEGMAEQELERVAEAAVARNGCLAAAVAHRTGRVAIGEASVVIAVSAAHRQPALAACAEIIDELKGSVPIWKKERYADGAEWIGRGS